MKKYLCIILTLLLSILLNLQICLAVSEIAVTEEMAGKIAYPYNRALQNGTWKLLEYVENEDGSIEYAMQLNEETVSFVKQQREGDKYIIEISENGMENIMTVDVDVEEKQIEYEQQMIQEVQGMNEGIIQEKGIPNEFLSRRTEAQLNELYRIYDKEGYSYDSCSIHEAEGDTFFETAVFVKHDREEQYIEEICLLVFSQSEDVLIPRGGNVVVSWNPDDITLIGDVNISCYSGNEEYYHAERLTQASNGSAGYTLEHKGNDLSGVAAIRMVPTYYPSEFDTNIAEMFEIEYVEDSNSLVTVILCILAVIFAITAVGKKRGRRK